MVLQGLEESIEVGRRWALHHPHPQMRSACKVLLQGWCWRSGRLGRGSWGVMAEKGGRGRYFGLRICPLLGPCPPSWLPPASAPGQLLPRSLFCHCPFSASHSPLHLSHLSTHHWRAFPPRETVERHSSDVASTTWCSYRPPGRQRATTPPCEP